MAKNHKQRPNKSRDVRNRRGSILVLGVAAFAAVAMIGGMSINLAYMEVVGTEQRLATDAATKAASVVLGQTQSVDLARAKAIQIAKLHSVAGRPLNLKKRDIVFGRSSRGSDGKFTFSPQSDTESNLNSVKVVSNLKHVSGGGTSILMMGSVFNPTSFKPVRNAIATRIDIDVALVVDRSGSMAWDLFNVPFQYPGQVGRFALNQRYIDLPDPVESRWAALTRAVGAFSTVLKNSDFEPRVSMASYASNFNFGVYTSTVASQDIALTNDFDLLVPKLQQIGSKPLIGNTNIAAGMREGINLLTDPSKSRVTSTKVMVLLSDGIMTQGSDPIELANIARGLNIKITTIAFSAQADVNLMRDISLAGGGQFYNAPDAQTLTKTFKEIAETLPAMLTK